MFRSPATDRSTQRSLRALARRAVTSAQAFATLADAPAVAVEERAAPAPHPHRRPLGGRARARRPGSVAVREQPCLSPIRR
jgi:hypothetical protein